MFVSYHVLVCGYRLVGQVQSAIAFGQSFGPLSASVFLLVGCLCVGLLILVGRIIEFADGHVLVALLHGLIGPAPHHQQGENRHVYSA